MSHKYTTKTKQEWFHLHAIYLQSEEWAVIRDYVINRDERCQKCKKRYRPGENFQVHHLSYKHWREANHEEADDCELLCYGCHLWIHTGKTIAQNIDDKLEEILCDTHSIKKEMGK